MSWKQVAPETYAEDPTEKERIEAFRLTEEDIRTVVGLPSDIEANINYTNIPNIS